MYQIVSKNCKRELFLKSGETCKKNQGLEVGQ